MPNIAQKKYPDLTDTVVSRAYDVSDTQRAYDKAHPQDKEIAHKARWGAMARLHAIVELDRRNKEREKKEDES